MNRLKGAMLVAALACAYAGTAAADEAMGFYAGVGIGQGSIEDDGIDFDEDDTGFKVFGGYQFNQYFAAELSYADFGNPDDSFGQAKLEIEAEQVSAAAVGTYAFNEYFGVMGRLGLSYVDASERISFAGTTVLDFDDNTTDFSYGIGLWAAPMKNFLLRLEYEKTRAGLDDFASDDVDLSLLSLSTVYKFGK
jgi:OOP family OmpA-OmpF porin